MVVVDYEIPILRHTIYGCGSMRNGRGYFGFSHDWPPQETFHGLGVINPVDVERI
jgi:hypothetical protein